MPFHKTLDSGEQHSVLERPRSQPFACFQRMDGAQYMMIFAHRFTPLVRFGSLLAAVVICSSASAGAGKDQAPVKKQRVVQKVTRKPCKVSVGGSAFPEPCDRLGEFPSTASPMHIIGALPAAQTR